MGNEDGLVPDIYIDEINFYKALSESLQKEIVELKARLDFIKKSSGDRFVPPENSSNRGED